MMGDSMSKTLNDVFYILLCVLLAFIELTWMGFVLSVCWHWFMTPFSGVVLGVAPSVGVAITARAFLGTGGGVYVANLKSGDKRVETLLKAVVGNMVSWLILLAIAFIVHLFMTM